ncbi:MAG: amidohydrolase family protein [Clostridia bacterium]|nr:amidohydrolase family protein [Clostridia bacterium]
MVTRIKNAVFVTDRLVTDRYLYLKNGRIAAFTSRELGFDEDYDAGGLYAAPGFIDIHLHGGGGCDFADGEVGDILAAAKAHAAHGTAVLYPTCASASFEDTLKFVKNVTLAMEQNAPGKPYIAGAHLEGPYFCDGMRGAQNPDYIKSPDPEEYTALCDGGNVSRISFAPELEGSDRLCEFLSERGIVAAYGHTEAVYSELKPMIERGCRLATHLYSGMNGVTRREGLRRLGGVETAYLEDSVTVEAIADGIHLPPELLRLIYRIKGADRICLVTDSMRAAGVEGEGPSVLGPRKDGVDCYVKNGVAYLPDMTAFAGSIATADRLLRTVYKQADVPLAAAVKMLTATPARVMGLADRGSFKRGNAADVVIFDENINIKALFLQGKQF